MTVETSIYTALKSLVNNRVYRDLAPDTNTTTPYITFQQVGGLSVNFVDSATIPDKRGARIQVNVWHSTRDAANALAIQAENALRPAASEVHGSFIATRDEETGLYGTIQDFSFFS